MSVAPVQGMRTRTKLFAAVAALALGACGSGVEGDEDMNRNLDAVFGDAATIEDELTSHETTVASAADVAAVEDADRVHAERMTARLDELDRVLSNMMTFCRYRESQERGRTHEMQAAAANVRAELERHRLAARPDLPSAQAEENMHLGQTRGAMKRIADAGAAMRHEAGFYRCDHGNH